jgi:hypothetical protein
MNKFKTVAAFVLMLISSCKVEFDPSMHEDPFPVVYGCICPEDSILFIKLNRSFTGEASAAEMMHNPDSIYFKDAVVELSLFNPVTDELVFSKDLVRNDLDEGDPNSILTTNSYRVYSLPTSNLPLTLFNTHYINLKAVLTVYIPSSLITCYATTYVYEKPWPINPMPGRIMELELYNELASKISWYSRGDKYQEVLVHFNYIEYNSDSISRKTAILKYLILIDKYPNSQEYLVEHFFYPVTFWNRLKKAIPQNDDIDYRKFVDLDFEIVGAGPEFYEYLALYGRFEDYGLDNATSNVINGRGVLYSKRRLMLLGHRLGAISMDSLSQGSITRSLKFVKW